MSTEMHTLYLLSRGATRRMLKCAFCILIPAMLKYSARCRIPYPSLIDRLWLDGTRYISSHTFSPISLSCWPGSPRATVILSRQLLPSGPLIRRSRLRRNPFSSPTCRCNQSFPCLRRRLLRRPALLFVLSRAQRSHPRSLRPQQHSYSPQRVLLHCPAPPLSLGNLPLRLR